MADYYELAQIANNPDFQSRVNYAMVSAAVQIMAEDPTTAQHVYRVTFAKKVLDASYSVPHVTMAVLTNSSLESEGNLASQAPGYSIPDSDLQFTVNSLWNTLAGVT